MPSALSLIDQCGLMVWRASWQASMLALAVFLVVTSLRSRLTAAWRYCLWSLVLVRLLLPLAPPAAWSPFNLTTAIEPPSVSTQHDIMHMSVDSQVDPIASAGAVQVEAGVVHPEAVAAAGPSLRREVPDESIGTSLGRIAVATWALGVLVMVIDLGRRVETLRRARRTWRLVTDSEVLERFEACRRRIGVRRGVVLCVAPGETGPAVSGAWRPRIVVPESLLADFDRDRLEVVLMHELAHIRRRDLDVHWLATAARVVHWFNPVAWFTLARLAAEREQACDDLVIEVVGPARRGFYAETILLLLCRVRGKPALLGTVPFFGPVRRLQARLESIASWSRPSLGWRGGFIAILIGLAAVGLTDAVRKTPTVQAQAAKAEAAPPKKADAPAEVRITGRVLDHRGAPMADAEIIALGNEVLTVYPTPQRGGVPVRLSWNTRGIDKPPSVKTDAKGRFTIERKRFPVDRLAVVATEILLWEVLTGDFADLADAVIKLPEPGALTIDCAIPAKPVTQEFHLVQAFPNPDNPADILYYRDVMAPNPGRVTTALPPGTYSIERINMTDHGSWGILMSPSERRLITIDAGKTALAEFNRKQGLALEGRVHGLEDVKLRYAQISIGYIGPKEKSPANGEPWQIFTSFDVIPIGSDGAFKTPPIPAGKYDFRVDAIRASTEHKEMQTSDYSGSVSVVVPAEGPAPVVEITAKPVSDAGMKQIGAAPPPEAAEPRLIVHVRDESGKPVQDFRAQLYAPRALIPDAIGESGEARFGARDLKDWREGDLIVAAPGFASTVLSQGAVRGVKNVDVTLQHGRRIAVHVRDSAGRPFAPDVWPSIATGIQVYAQRHRMFARESFVLTDPETRMRFVKQMNFLNIAPASGVASELEFQIPEDRPEPVFFAFHDPERLRFFEVGPVAFEGRGDWEVRIPEPSNVEVSLKDHPGKDGGPSLFASARFMLLPNIPGKEQGVSVLETGELKAPEWRAVIRNIAPENYKVHLATQPTAPVDPSRYMDAAPGLFRDIREIVVDAGRPVAIAFDPPPLDFNAWRGSRSATIRIAPTGDRKPAGESYRVLYVLPNYGGIPVAEGKVPDDGAIRLDGIAPSGPDGVGPSYALIVGGKNLGVFRVKDEPGRQVVTFWTPIQKGDLAPDAEAEELATGRKLKLASYRGRFVFLEFWATWCGPCREPMEKLVELAERRGKEWGDRVALVAVGIDKDRDALAREVVGQRPTSIQHLWSPDFRSERPDTASTVYSVDSVPTAFLIDAEGRIVWTGHPRSLNLEAELDKLLER